MLIRGVLSAQRRLFNLSFVDFSLAPARTCFDDSALTLDSLYLSVWNSSVQCPVKEYASEGETDQGVEEWRRKENKRPRVGLRGIASMLDELRNISG